MQVTPADIFSGVTVLRLENGDEAVYIHGLFLECADIAQGDRPLADIAARLAGLLKMPFRQITLPVPEDEEWCWNDIVDALLTGTGSGGTITARTPA
ncbi:putative cytoplasmic protein [Salmonella enterica]|uniref:Putative cytoplasmic protein n=1 Tax=Salmonella enterica TaxID=28901 RepID=A0A7D8EXU7_SALER|nr:putative cytoplasmic protein [Salmonella enterica]